MCLCQIAIKLHYMGQFKLRGGHFSTGQQLPCDRSATHELEAPKTKRHTDSVIGLTVVNPFFLGIGKTAFQDQVQRLAHSAPPPVARAFSESQDQCSTCNILLGLLPPSSICRLARCQLSPHLPKGCNSLEIHLLRWRLLPSQLLLTPLRSRWPQLPPPLLSRTHSLSLTSLISSDVIGSSPGNTSSILSSPLKRTKMALIPGLSSLPNFTPTWSSAP